VNRAVLTVDLKNDPAAIETYVTHHRRVWPEVLESLKRVGVVDMEIYILARRLVMIVEVKDGIDIRRAFAAHHATEGRVQEWEALMQSLLLAPPGSTPGEWWTLMQPVFHLQEDASWTT